VPKSAIFNFNRRTAHRRRSVESTRESTGAEGRRWGSAHEMRIKSRVLWRCRERRRTAAPHDAGASPRPRGAFGRLRAHWPRGRGRGRAFAAVLKLVFRRQARLRRGSRRDRGVLAGVRREARSRCCKHRTPTPAGGFPRPHAGRRHCPARQLTVLVLVVVLVLEALGCGWATLRTFRPLRGRSS